MHCAYPILTGMAQRQRAGLITPRSLDRNGLPVFIHFASFTEAGRQAGRKREQPHFTGMAQGQRAGLITPRSLDRNGLPVSITHRIGASRH